MRHVRSRRRRVDAAAGPDGRRGIVLFAAVVFLAVLAVIIARQFELLAFATAESKAAGRVLQRRIEMDSALELAVGALVADAAANDYDASGDAWAGPLGAELDGVRIEARLVDFVMGEEPEDKWLRHDEGLTDADVDRPVSRDPYVVELFEEEPPNVNTAPTRLLRDAGIATAHARRIVERRRERPFERIEELGGIRGLRGSELTAAMRATDCVSRLFLAEGRVERPDGTVEGWTWLLRREEGEVRVIHSYPSNPEEGL